MNQDGEPMSRWLQKIEKDQNVSKLSDVWATLKNGLGKKWFVRQDIAPTIHLGWYNSATGKYEPGMHDVEEVPLCQYSAVSLGTNTLDCPAGYIYVVYIAATQNATRAGTVSFAGVVGGVTVADIADSGAGAMTQSETEYVLGGATGTSGLAGAAGPIVLDGDLGDELTITQGNFVAADVVRYIWLGKQIQKVV